MSTTSTLDVISLNSSTIPAVINGGVRSGVELVESYGSGDVSRLFIGHARQGPEVTGTTEDLLALLVTEGVGVFGKAIGSASHIYFKLVPEVGRDDRTAESHTRCTVNDGVVYWTTINLTQDFATADFVIAAGYDGTNAPVVASGSVALPASELSTGTRFAVGPIQLNGTLVTAIQEVTIESGLEVEKKFSDGVPWPYRINLKRCAPSARIVTETISHLTATGLVGGALNGTTGLAMYARKYVNNAASGAQRVAAATAEHLKFTGLDGTYRVEEVNGSGTDAVQLVINADLGVGDSSDTPLTIATSAIPTS